MKYFRRTSTLVLFAFLAIISVVSEGYSYWDSIDKPNIETINLGTWDFGTMPISNAFASNIASYIDDQLVLDPNSDLQHIYDQTGNLSNTTVTVENINVYGYDWDFFGIGTATPSTTLGYASLIDRVDNLGTPIHPILTLYTTTPTYPEYDYFTSYDAKNLLTNNQYSLRLNYGVTMTTDQLVSNLTQISFYASRGLLSPDDPFTMATDRQFSVEISTDGLSWVQLGSATPPVPSANEYNFTLYTYDITAPYLGSDLYVRIVYNGQAIKQGNSRSYSRMIIDELELITN